VHDAITGLAKNTSRSDRARIFDGFCICLNSLNLCPISTLHEKNYKGGPTNSCPCLREISAIFSNDKSSFPRAA